MMDMDKSIVAIVHRTHINAIHIQYKSGVGFHYHQPEQANYGETFYVV